MSRIPCLNLILIAKLTRGVSPYQVRRLIKEECSSSKGEGIVDGKKRFSQIKMKKQLYRKQFPVELLTEEPYYQS